MGLVVLDVVIIVDGGYIYIIRYLFYNKDFGVVMFFFGIEVLLRFFVF